MSDQETTLKVNVTYVGDLKDALKDVPHDRRIEVRTLVVGSGLALDEVTINERGNLVLWVGV